MTQPSCWYIYTYKHAPLPRLVSFGRVESWSHSDVEVWSDPPTPLPFFFCFSRALDFSIFLCILGHVTQLVVHDLSSTSRNRNGLHKQAQLIELVTPLSCTHALSVTCSKCSYSLISWPAIFFCMHSFFSFYCFWYLLHLPMRPKPWLRAGQ